MSAKSVGRQTSTAIAVPTAAELEASANRDKPRFNGPRCAVSVLSGCVTIVFVGLTAFMISWTIDVGLIAVGAMYTSIFAGATATFGFVTHKLARGIFERKPLPASTKSDA